MSRRADMAEAWVNAVVGLGISWSLVEALRGAGAWDAPAPLLSAVFFAASVARGFAIRRLFRGRS